MLRWLRRASENHHEQSRSLKVLARQPEAVKPSKLLNTSVLAAQCLVDQLLEAESPLMEFPMCTGFVLPGPEVFVG